MTDEEISKLWLNHYPSANDFARAIIAARDEELRKQEPVGFGCFDPAGFLDQDLVGTEADCIFWRDSPDATNKWTVKALFTAPIPPTRIKDFSELRDELDAAPLPPTPNPSQQEALDALDNMDDYARMAGLIAIGPIETLRDFILARPDTGIGK